MCVCACTRARARLSCVMCDERFVKKSVARKMSRTEIIIEAVATKHLPVRHVRRKRKRRKEKEWKKKCVKKSIRSRYNFLFRLRRASSREHDRVRNASVSNERRIKLMRARTFAGAIVFFVAVARSILVLHRVSTSSTDEQARQKQPQRAEKRSCNVYGSTQ